MSNWTGTRASLQTRYFSRAKVSHFLHEPVCPGLALALLVVTLLVVDVAAFASDCDVAVAEGRVVPPHVEQGLARRRG